MSDAHQKLEAIRRLILADLDATSDEDLRKELIEDGECPEKVAEGMKVSLEALTRKFQHGASVPLNVEAEQPSPPSGADKVTSPAANE